MLKSLKFNCNWDSTLFPLVHLKLLKLMVVLQPVQSLQPVGVDYSLFASCVQLCGVFYLTAPAPPTAPPTVGLSGRPPRTPPITSATLSRPSNSTVGSKRGPTAATGAPTVCHPPTRLTDCCCCFRREEPLVPRQ